MSTLALLSQQRAERTAVYECVWSVCMNIMGWRAVVLSGREVGVAEWAVSCVHMGGGGRGNGRTMNIMGWWWWWGCMRWKDGSTYGIWSE